MSQVNKELNILIKAVARHYTSEVKKEASLDTLSLDSKLTERLKAVGLEEFADVIDSKIGAQHQGVYSIILTFFQNTVYILNTLSLLIFSLLSIAVVGGMRTVQLAAPDEPSIAQAYLSPTQINKDGYLNTNTTFQVRTAKPVEGDIKESIKITPKIDFEIISTSESSFEIKPKEILNKDITYTVSLDKGMRFTDGTEMGSELHWILPVAPQLTVLAIRPSNELKAVSIFSPIEFELNSSEFDLLSFKESFSIEPSVEGNFIVHGHKVTFFPLAPLAANQLYKITISDQFEDRSGGSLKEPFKSEFFTESSDQASEYIGSSIVWKGDVTRVALVEKTLEGELISLEGDLPLQGELYKLSGEEFWKLLPAKESTVMTDLLSHKKALLTKEITFLNRVSSFNYTLDQEGIYLLRLSSEEAPEKFEYRYIIKTVLSKSLLDSTAPQLGALISFIDNGFEANSIALAEKENLLSEGLSRYLLNSTSTYISSNSEMVNSDQYVKSSGKGGITVGMTNLLSTASYSLKLISKSDPSAKATSNSWEGDKLSSFSFPVIEPGIYTLTLSKKEPEGVFQDISSRSFIIKPQESAFKLELSSITDKYKAGQSIPVKIKVTPVEKGIPLKGELEVQVRYGTIAPQGVVDSEGALSSGKVPLKVEDDKLYQSSVLQFDSTGEVEYIFTPLLKESGQYRYLVTVSLPDGNSLFKEFIVEL